jgi:hypothetical protein
MPSLTNLATILGQIKRNGGIPRRDLGISQGVSQGASPGVSQGAYQGINPSLIDLASIFGGGPSAPTGPTGPSAPTAPTFDSYDATPDLNLANAAEQDAYGMKPTEVRSNYGTKDLLALLVAALAGERGGDVLSGYMQGKQQSQAQRMAAAAQADQMAQQKKLQEAAAIRAGIPFKQSRVDKANELLNDQFKIQTDAYNKDQTNKRILSVEDKKDQTHRWVINQQLLDKKPYTYRAQWAMENLDITDPDILERLSKPNADELNKIAAAKLSDAKRTTENNLRQYRVDTFTSKIGLTKEQAKYLAAKTLALPAREAAIVAHLKKQDQGINAQMTNLTRLANYRDKLLNQKDRQMADANLRAAIQSFDKSVTSAQQAVNGARSRLNALQTEYDIEPEKNADGSINPDRKALQAQLKDASKFYAHMVAESDKVIKKAQNLKKSLNPKAEMAAQIEGEIANKFGPGDGVRVAPVATDLGIPPAPGKSDISMGKPTATPPKGKTGKMPSGFKRIQ